MDLWLRIFWINFVVVYTPVVRKHGGTCREIGSRIKCHHLNEKRCSFFAFCQTFTVILWYPFTICPIFFFFSPLFNEYIIHHRWWWCRSTPFYRPSVSYESINDPSHPEFRSNIRKQVAIDFLSNLVKTDATDCCTEGPSVHQLASKTFAYFYRFLSVPFFSRVLNGSHAGHSTRAHY